MEISLCDRKQYRRLTLPCGLQVLLVQSHSESIETTNQAAAALSVQSGSYQDDVNLGKVPLLFLHDQYFANLSFTGGCAHFLEHMLFMGSAKYPQENAYDSFVTSNGGSCNAYTEGECTVYQFDVTHDVFAAALDIFAQCFLSPLLSTEAMSREINSIQSELELQLTEDESRLSQLMGHQCREDHVLHKFSWGSKASLSTDPLAKGLDPVQILRQFYSDYYKLPLMSLVLVSSHSLEVMENMVRTCFQSYDSALKTLPPLVPPAKHQESFAFPVESLATLTKVTAVGGSHRLTIAWQVPSMITHYRSKPCEYISFILGHEGEGSLLHRLQSLQLAQNDLSAGVGGDPGSFENNSLQALFTISIELTANGLRQWPEVVGIVSEYMTMLREMEPQEWLFRELQQMAQIAFDYMDEEDPASFAERLSTQSLPFLHREERHLLSGPFLFHEWNPTQIKELLQGYFGMRQAKIYIMSRAYDNDEDDDDDADDDADDANDDEEEDGSEASDSEEDSDGEDSDEDSEESSLENDGEDPLSSESLTLLYTSASNAILPLIQRPTTAPQIEPYFDIPYWEEAIPGWLYDSWEGRGKGSAVLPSANPFIPTDLIVLSTTSLTVVAMETDDELEEERSRLKRQRIDDTTTTATITPSSSTESPDITILKHTSHQAWLFHSQDTRYGPKVSLILEVRPPIPSTKANATNQSIAADLLLRLAKDNLIVQAWYAAEQAGLGAEIAPTVQGGCHIRISGFSQHALCLLLTSLRVLLLQTIITLDDKNDVDKVEQAKEKLLRRYRDNSLTASRVAEEGRLAILLSDGIMAKEKLDLLLTLSIEALIHAVQELQMSWRVQSECWLLCQGNVCLTDTQAALQTMLSECNTTGAEAVVADWNTVHNMSVDNSYLPLVGTIIPSNNIHTVIGQATSPKEKNSAIELYFQHPAHAHDIIALSTLQLIHAAFSERCFDQLRTVQQLGYDVGFSIRETRDRLGVCIHVVSSTKPIDELLQSLLAFIQSMENTLLNVITDAEMINIVKSLLASKQQPQLSLHEAVQRRWSEIEDRLFRFELVPQQIAWLQSLLLMPVEQVKACLLDTLRLLFGTAADSNATTVTKAAKGRRGGKNKNKNKNKKDPPAVASSSSAAVIKKPRIVISMCNPGIGQMVSSQAAVEKKVMKTLRSSFSGAQVKIVDLANR